MVSISPVPSSLRTGKVTSRARVAKMADVAYHRVDCVLPIGLLHCRTVPYDRLEPS